MVLSIGCLGSLQGSHIPSLFGHVPREREGEERHSFSCRRQGLFVCMDQQTLDRSRLWIISPGSGVVSNAVMWACFCLPESTALKRPSNGATEMKADRVEQAGLSPCQDLLAFCSISGQAAMSLGHGGRERGAGVSRSECEHCGLGRRWGGW